MKYCSIPIDLKVVEGKPRYSRCGEKAAYKIKNSAWYICKNHVAYANEQKWELEELKKN